MSIKENEIINIYNLWMRDIITSSEAMRRIGEILKTKEGEFRLIDKNTNEVLLEGKALTNINGKW